MLWTFRTAFTIIIVNYTYAQQTLYKRPDFHDSQDTLEWKAEFALLNPYQLWDNVTYKFLEMENMTDCDCPRVYFPSCGVDEVTYVNPCIIRCLGKEMKRFGPCLLFRRSNEQFISLPKIWRRSHNHTQNIQVQTSNLTVLTDDGIPVIMMSGDEFEQQTINDTTQVKVEANSGVLGELREKTVVDVNLLKNERK